MFKKAISWVLLFALLCTCLIIPAVAEEPTSDAEAVEQGYQFKVVTKEGTTSYLKMGTSGDFTLGSDIVAESTVTLLSDLTVTLTNRLILAYSGTFDGGGHTISGKSGSYLVGVSSQDMTVRNLNLTQTEKSLNENKDTWYPSAVQLQANAKAEFEKCTLHTTDDCLWSATIVLQEGSHAILNSGTKVISDGAAPNGTASVAVLFNAKNTKLTVNEGAEITTKYANTVKANVKDVTNTTFTINGGTITTGRWLWESNVANGHTLTINGGTFICNSSNQLIKTYNTTLPTVNLLGGTFITKDGKNIIDTNGAVSKLGGKITLNGKVIFEEPSSGDVTNQDVTLCLPVNATEENSGIRFETRLDKEWIDTLVAGGATITTGTILAPKSLVDVENFTLDSLKGFGLKIENDGWNNTATAETDGYYCYFANMVDLSDKSLTNEIVGVGYITITIDGIGTVTYYGTVQSGIVRDIASGMTGANDAQNAVLRFFRGSAT